MFNSDAHSIVTRSYRCNGGRRIQYTFYPRSIHTCLPNRVRSPRATTSALCREISSASHLRKNKTPTEESVARWWGVGGGRVGLPSPPTPLRPALGSRQAATRRGNVSKVSSAPGKRGSSMGGVKQKRGGKQHRRGTATQRPRSWAPMDGRARETALDAVPRVAGALQARPRR